MNPITNLENEVAGLEKMAATHAEAAANAAREHRAGLITDQALQEIVSTRAAVDYALSETRRELEEARAAADAAERAAEDERLLAAIARATVDYRAAEAEHRELLHDVQQTIARGILRSHELLRASSAARTSARDAATQLAERHGHDPKRPHDAYQRAVIGADVEPLTGGETSVRWPGHGHYPLLRNIPDEIRGVQVDDPA